MTATFFIVTPNRGQLDERAALVNSDRLHVAIAQRFAPDEGREA